MLFSYADNAILYLPSIQWCVLLPVVLTLIANQGKEDRFTQSFREYCYPTWALEAFLIANAQRSVHFTFNLIPVAVKLPDILHGVLRLLANNQTDNHILFDTNTKLS